MNQVTLVGKIINDPDAMISKDDIPTADLMLEVGRNIKNAEGIYEKDIIICKLNGNLASATSDYCKIGDVVGIKGELRSKIDKAKDGSETITLYLEPNKITFISSRNIPKAKNCER